MVVEWGTCVVCCGEKKCSGTKGSEETRHEPQDLSVTVEIGLSRTLGYQVR